MEGDLTELIGTLLRVLDGGRISREEVEDLAFEAGAELQVALNEAYITLLEFAYDCDAGGNDERLGDEMRAALQRSLDEIIRCSDPLPAKGSEASDPDT